jgi:quercetin dioxygenase-like cupin family protein
MAYIDPTVVSPNEYKLLFEDDTVRVVEMTLPAGVSDAEHSHPHEVVYFLKGGEARIHVGDDAVEAEVPDGHVMAHEPWTHRVENIGTTDIHAIIFERKS